MSTRTVSGFLLCTGTSILGNEGLVKITPIDKEGIFIKKGHGEATILPNWKRESTAFHYVRLSSGGEQLDIVEHLLGYLYLRSFSGLLLEVPKRVGIPYDGCAKIFHDQIDQFALKKSKERNPVTVKRPLEMSMKRGYLRFLPAEQGDDDLYFDVRVNYAGFGEYHLQTSFKLLDVNQVAKARSYGRPGLQRVMAEFFHRTEHFVWLDQESVAEQLKEIAFHRILDLCGALALADIPSQHRLAGRIETCFAGHSDDLRLLNGLELEVLQEV